MSRRAHRDRLRVGTDGWLAGVAFLLLALAGTWPLAGALTSSLPGDYGDPLFVTWVMAWVARHLTRALTGDVGALAAMWDAPIFAPEANTLAFSEHFVGQAVQALPVYWLTGNPLLAYNLVFLATFVLSGVGAYLLVRDLTGSRLGGLVAGALFAVNDFRTGSLSHLHTLSAQWVPLACLGLLHFARSGSRRALAFAAVSVIALNTSSGYYMLYCDPLIGVFGLVGAGTPHGLAHAPRLDGPGRGGHGGGARATAARVALSGAAAGAPVRAFARRAGVGTPTRWISTGRGCRIWGRCWRWRRPAGWAGGARTSGCAGQSCSLPWPAS